MDELLQNPAIRSGVLPFLIAAVLSVALRPLGWYAVGLAFVSALTVQLIMLVGINIFPPKVNTHKVIVLGLAAAALGLARDAIGGRAATWLTVSTLAAIGAIVWVVYPVLMRAESTDRVLAFTGVVAFFAALFFCVERLRPLPILPAAMLTWLGLGVGGTALLGATALYGEVGIAVGAAAGGVALTSMFGAVPRLGATLLYPGLWFSGAVGVAAAVFSNLRWYSLAPLVLIPLIAAIPLPEHWTPRRKVILLSIPMILLAAFAIFVTWYSSRGEGVSEY